MSANVASVYGGFNSTGLDSKVLPQGIDIEVSVTPWVRNPSWPACSAAAGDNKITGLFAVFPDAVSGTGSNFFAVSITGDYQINYGDGTSTAYTSGTAAYYNYDFNDVELSGTNAPIIFNASAGVVERTAHGYTNGMPVSFYAITSTSGVSEGFSYYVVSATTDTFKFATVVDGSAVAFTNDGTATLLPYKVAVFTITPQSGSSLVNVDLGKKHNQSGLQTYSTGYLELLIASSTITNLTISGTTTNVAQSRLVEQVKLLELGVCDSFPNMFNTCLNLQSVVIADTITSITSTSNMFNTCRKLEIAPLFNTSSVTNASSMFTNCTNLRKVPLYSTAAVSTMSGMFFNCLILTTVPLFDTSSVVDMSSMFSGCYSLQRVPLFDTNTVTSMASMFVNCYILKTVPLFNTSLVDNTTAMFSNCWGLKEVPLFNTVSLTNATSMFAFCYNLTSVPLFNTSSVTTMASMFSNCINLKKVPLFDTSSVTTMLNMFLNCYSLPEIPLFNTSLVTSFSSTFSGCSNLKTVPLFNTTSLLNMNGMFTNCLKLEYVPEFNTALVQQMASLFSNCRQLVTVPKFNTSSVQSMNSMFNGCNSLNFVPSFDVGAIVASSGYSSFVSECYSLKRIQATGFKYTFSVANCMLSSAALNEIYTNLATVTGQTITVSGNYGTTGDDPTIATAKGWTVSG
jgi:surface protein